MPIQVVLAAVAVSASIPILWWSLASDRTKPKAADGGLSTGGTSTNVRRLTLESGAGSRAVVPAIRSFGSALMRLTPVGWIAALRRNLMLAGHHGDTYALERILVLKVALAVLGFSIGFFPFTDLTGLQHFALTVAFTALGFFIPDGIVSRQGRQRQEQIELEMPDTLDQVTMAVEAGLGFEAALVRASRAGDGPLAEELNRTLREIQLGIPRNQALTQLADRTDVPDLDSFVLSVVQSEKYGIGIGQVLRVQSEELRDKRRQRAEERALKIPVLMIFPLAFCIFPAMFIVILGPAAIRIFRELGSAL
ncbi:MAG: type II secretion system F family protein [Actinomycetia bacterium]|nr:type II secretion system F family protein [Actinomycetes bacterium]